MRLIEIIRPNIDKEALTIETLRDSFANVVYSYYKDNVSNTNNYTINVIDTFSFEELNQYVIAVSRLLTIAGEIFGTESETYKIAYFLSEYFSYYDN
jgi:hypothetical protein